MNRETIIQMAREAGLAEVTDTAESLPADYVDALAKLCAMAVAKEREKCAKVCESTAWATSIDEWRDMTKKDVADKSMHACAYAIRARGEAV